MVRPRYCAIGLLTWLCFITALWSDDFQNGSPEFDPSATPDYSNEEIQKRIQNEMAIACTRGLCSIEGSNSEGESFTISFNIGYGTQNPGMTGGSQGSTGVFIVGSNGTLPNNQPGYWSGITVTYKTYTCHSELQVTPAVYRFLNTYLYTMVNTDGSVQRNFSPADQTVILFYTTLLSKADSCKPNGLELSAR